jgi:hypothetical protein
MKAITNINLSTLQAGVYFISINNENGTIIKKLIVE